MLIAEFDTGNGTTKKIMVGIFQPFFSNKATGRAERSIQVVVCWVRTGAGELQHCYQKNQFDLHDK